MVLAHCYSLFACAIPILRSCRCPSPVASMSLWSCLAFGQPSIPPPLFPLFPFSHALHSPPWCVRVCVCVCGGACECVYGWVCGSHDALLFVAIACVSGPCPWSPWWPAMSMVWSYLVDYDGGKLHLHIPHRRYCNFPVMSAMYITFVSSPASPCLHRRRRLSSCVPSVLRPMLSVVSPFPFPAR